MNICYIGSPYRSFARAAQFHTRILSEVGHLTRIRDADVAVVHCEPFRYASIYRMWPLLRKKYVVGCATWEAMGVPKAYVAGLSLVQEVWTCSRYCESLFKDIHGEVHVIPHVISRDMSFGPEDIRYVQERIGYDPITLYYLSVTHVDDPRKNALGLVKAFVRFHEKHPQCKLIVKGYSSDRDQPAVPGCIFINRDFTDRQLNALYSMVSIFASAHHSEGWGFAIADAVLFGLPTVSTNHSGNLDYLDEETSYLIPAQVREIEPQDCSGFFSSGMKWAYMTSEQIESTLARAYEDVVSGRSSELVARAFDHASKFDENAARRLLHERLDAISKRLASRL